MTRLLSLILILLASNQLLAQPSANSLDFAFCIAAPNRDDLSRFVEFVDKELGPNGINTLILRVDWNFDFKSYPNLSDDNPLTAADVKKLVKVADKHHIKLIPQINLLGHQSWAETTYALLSEYPEFDETPHVEMPEKYEWPNEDGLYCRSYCPLHPEVHQVVFALVDEIVEAFESDDFHAGMDEVFYLGDDQCPRCGGKDKAALYAGEVTKIRDHLAKDNVRLWIWGDRLLDGEESGLGIWEASGNHTAGAIELIPKDVVINDWHYNAAVPTPAHFATKGFGVYSCFWNKSQVAVDHLEMMTLLKATSPDPIKSRLIGTMQTVWSPARAFLDAYYGKSDNEGATAQAECFKAMLKWMNNRPE